MNREPLDTTDTTNILTHTFVIRPENMQPRQLLPAVLDQMEVAGAIWITRINVPKGCRGNGYGRLLLKMATSAADIQHYELRIIPQAYGSGNDPTTDDLIAWYQREGFVKERGGYFLRKPSF